MPDLIVDMCIKPIQSWANIKDKEAAGRSLYALYAPVLFEGTSLSGFSLFVFSLCDLGVLAVKSFAVRSSPASPGGIHSDKPAQNHLIFKAKSVLLLGEA